MLKIEGIDPILNVIGKQILEISKGNFDYEADLLPGDNEYNIVVSGLNMLSQEIKDITFSKNFFNNIFNSSPDAIFIVDDHGKFQMQNNEAVQFQKKCKHKYNEIDCLLSNLDKNILFEDIVKTLKKSKFFKQEMILKELNETYELRIKKIDTKEKRYIVILVNITLLKQYQNEIEASEHKYKSVFNLSNNAIFLMNTSWYLIEGNSTFYKYTKTPKNSKEYLGNRILLPNESTFSLARQLIKGDSIHNKEINIIANKKKLTAELSIIRINDPKTNSIYYLGILKDITAIKSEMTISARTINFEQEKIRKQIALELHDSIGQQLSAIRFMTNSLKPSLKDQPKILENVELISSSVFNAIQELRDLCFNLMPASLQAHGLENTIRETTSRLMNASEDIDFQLVFKNIDEKMPLEFSVNAYRIVQEIISNALKHAECSLIYIELEEKNNQLNIKIKDNGKGFDYNNLKKLSGTGMKSIQSRIDFYGGSLKFTKSKEFNTEFNIIMPVLSSSNRIKSKK